MADALVDNISIEPPAELYQSYQQGDPFAVVQLGTELESRTEATTVEFELLDVSEVDGLSSDQKVQLMLTPTEGGWTVEVVGQAIVEYGDTQDLAKRSLIETLYSLRDIYLNQPDDALTADAIRLRDWLSEIF